MADINMLKPSTGRIVASSLRLVMIITSLASTSLALSSCDGPCNTLDDCAGQLICINNKCNDNPDMGTHICHPGGGGSSPSQPSGGGCKSSGSLQCGGTSYPQYTCPPPVTGSTRAILTNNNFSQGGDGGGPSKCDGRYHENSERIVALSAGWYSGGSRCGRMIKITSMKTGRSVHANVVDECDSVNGCDSKNVGQPPFRNNIVDCSNGVWDSLVLDTNIGEEEVYWTMA